MGKEGNENEALILVNLNNKKFKQLNNNWRIFFNEIFDIELRDDETIRCSKKAGIHKSDLKVTIKGKSKTLSVKIGTGNSVHQEPVEEFIKFLEDTYSINKELTNYIRFFIWGDGTLNGKGKVEHRLSASKFNKEYPEITEKIKDFFKQHKRDLIQRFVITGSKSKSSPDYIYYGNYNKGVWKKTKEALDWLCEDLNESHGAIPVGKLTFQAWNRNINGGNKSEKKRGVIQLKWGSVGSDLKKLFKKK